MESFKKFISEGSFVSQTYHSVEHPNNLGAQRLIHS